MSGAIFDGATAMPRPVRITLQGKPYTLQTDEEERHVQEVATAVDRRVADLRAKLAGAPASEAMMFAAMTFADDLVKERAKHAADLAAAKAVAAQLHARLTALAGR